MGKKKLRILLVEDHATDAELAEKELRASGLKFIIRRVEAKDEFVDALDDFKPDIIISDYSLPQFDGKDVLRISIRKFPSLPIIILTGSMNEETAVDCMKSGAWDYVIKDHMRRLPYAVKEALEKRDILIAKEKAERALIDSENRFRSLLDTVQNLAVQGYSPDGTVRYWNKSSEDLYGYSADEAMGKNLVDLIIPPEMKEGVKKAIKKMMKTGKGHPAEELMLMRKDGTRVPVYSNHTVIDIPGKGKELFCIDIDLTARKATEEDLRFERNMLRALLEHTPDMMWFKDCESRYVATSTSHADYLGVSPGDLKGKSDLDVYPDQMAKQWLGDEKRIMETAEPIIGDENRARSPAHGVESWVSTTKIPWYDENGKVIGTFGISRDITELKRVEKELADERDLLQHIMDVLPHAVYCKDVEGRWVHASKGFYSDYEEYCQRTGVKQITDVIGKTDLDLFPEAHAKAAYEDDLRVIQGNESIVRKIEHVKFTDGFEQYILTTKVPRYDKDGNVVGLVGTSQNINELKKLERELAAERDLLRYITDVLPISFYCKDAEGRWIHLSKGFYSEYENYCILAGIEPLKNLLGKTDLDIFQKDHAKSMFEDDMRVLRNGESIIRKVEQFATNDGKEHYALTTKVPRLDHRGNIIGLVGTSQTITDMKMLEKEVAAERDLLMNLMETLPTPVYIKDRESRLVQVSGGYRTGYRRYCELFGLEYTDDIYGKTDVELFLPEHGKRMVEDERWLLESGEPIIKKMEYLTGPDGKEIYTMTTKVPRFDKNGEIAGIIGISEDITEMKILEREIARERDLLKNLMQTLPAAVYLKDREGRLIHVSGGYHKQYKEYCEKFGIAHNDDVIGKTDRDLFAGDHVTGMSADDRRVIESGESLIRRLEYFTNPDGTELHILSTKVPQFDREGNIIGLIGVSEDVSEIKNLEREIARERDLLRNLMDSLPLSVFVKDTEGRIQWVSKHYLTQEGAPADILLTDLIGKTDFDIYPEDLALEAAEDDRFVMESRQPIINKEEYSKTADGTEVVLQVIKAPMYDSEGNVIGIVGASRNITEQKKIEERIRLQSAALEASANAIVITDRDGAILYVNPSFVALTGYTEDEAIGKNLRNLLKSGEQNEDFYADMWETILSGQVWHGELINRRKDGSLYYEEQTITPVQDVNGYINYFVSIKQDITERKVTEEAIAEREKQLSAIANNLPGPASRVDRNLRYLYVNNWYERTFGIAPDEMLGRTVPEVIGEEVYANLKTHIDRVLSGEKVNYESTVVKQGRSITHELTMIPDITSDGSVNGYFLTGIDITLRKRTHEFQQAENRVLTLLGQGAELKEILDSIASLGEKYDPTIKTSVMLADPGKERLFIISAPSLQREYIAALEPGLPIGPDIGSCGTAAFLKRRVVVSDIANDKRWAPAAAKNTMAFGYHACWSEPIIGSDGNILGTIANYCSKRGEPDSDNLRILEWSARIAGFAIERKHAEEAIQSSEERFRSLYENTSLGLYRTTPDGRILLANPALVKMLGYETFSEIEHLNLETHGFLNTRHRTEFKELMSSQGEMVGYETEWMRKDGTRVFIRESAKAIRNEDGEVHYYDGTVEDITERKIAEVALRESEEQYRKFFEDDISADFITTNDGNVIACNPAYLELFGFSSYADAYQKNLWELFPSPEEQSKIFALVRRNRKLEAHEMDLRRNDGSLIHIVANIFGIYDGGDLVQLKGYLIDDTKRKKLESQLLQAQKLESIGQLAGGVAHDLNNVLGAIMGYADLGRKKISEQHPLYNRLDKILDLTVRGARITEQLLAFSRRQVIEPRKIDLNTLISDLLKLLGKTLGEHITINFKGDPDARTVYVDPGQMDQVIMNLCINARDAMPGGGVLNISTRNVTIDEEYAQYHLDATPGSYVVMSISDTGIGIPPDALERIFDPFFTTKEVGKGTGLGLSVVHGIIGQHHGFINVYSEVDVGTTFSLYIPSIDEDPDEHSVKTIREVPKGSGTILVVEDDKDILSMINILLDAQGYSVLSASNGEEGIAVFKEKAAEIDMIITDVVMPKMSGREFFERLREMKPHLPCLFISGYTADIMPQNFILDEGADFIAKPFSPSDFNQKVYEIINRGKKE
jgi:two-component system, cell cycle sensor histidine kinase and response regulator CckA